MAARDDIELMQHVDGELDERDLAQLEDRLGNDPEARAKHESLSQLDEMVRGHLELAADNVSERRFDAMWKEIDVAIGPAAAPARRSARSKIGSWFDRYRGHLITGAVSAGAVAALALILRPDTTDDSTQAVRSQAIDVRPASMRAQPEIESLDTPDGEGTVLNLEDEDGHTTVIWVTPEDTVEGI